MLLIRAAVGTGAIVGWLVEKWVTNTGEKVSDDPSYRRRRRLGAAGFHQPSYYKFVARDSGRPLYGFDASLFSFFFFFFLASHRRVCACQIPRPNAANLSMFRVVSRSGNERLFRQLGICLLSIRVQSLVPVLRSSKKKRKKKNGWNFTKMRNIFRLRTLEEYFFFFLSLPMMNDFITYLVHRSRRARVGISNKRR